CGEGFQTDEAALAVAALRPRVRIEHEDAPDGARGQARQNAHRIVVPDAQVGNAVLLNPGKELRHAVDEGLAADETDVRVLASPGEQVLAAAEADLEPDVADRMRKEAG